MIERRLRRQLDEVALRCRRMRAATWLAVVWTGLATIGTILLGLNRNLGVYVRGETMAFAVIGGAATLIALVLSWRVGRDTRAVARKIENKYPQLDARLLTAVEQHPELPDHRFGYLQQSVIQEAVLHGYRNDWRRAFPSWQYGLALLACLLGGIAMVTSGVRLYRFIRPTELGMAPLLGLFREQLPSPARLASVEPGDTSVERGASVLVLARFEGQLPSECILRVDDPQSSSARQLNMKQSLDDPVFGGRVVGVEQDIDYQVTYDGDISPSYRITVFEYPALQSADAVLDFPDYTSMQTATVQDVRHVTAVEGTQLTLRCKLNKPVAEATFVADDGETLELVAESADSSVRTLTSPMAKSQRLTLRLVDDEGRKNRQPPEFVLSVTPNQRPTLRLVFPSHDVQVSPIEELQLSAQLWDDFSLTRFGVTYQFAENPEQEVLLGEDVQTKEKLTVDHVLAFEELGAQPNQLLSYYVWAEDVGPDGQKRRTMSDMFFADVRHFEEIYRQGQQPPGGADQQQQPQSGQGPQSGAGQAQQLAELQKEIMNATWNLLRGGQTDGIPESYADDVAVVRDSQSALIRQTNQLAQRSDDAQLQAIAADVMQHMRDVVAVLERAISETSLDALQSALAPEQAAYQSLLQLRAREFQVIRSNQRSQQQSRAGGGGGAGRSQQQLQQLALANDQNRYETQRQASQQQDDVQSEDRQILNRLRELARRQNDLNERLKELQSELEQAATQDEKEELLKQLKRLREEQQEVLRDADELNSRMNRPQNPSESGEARQRLQQAREDVRRASEALEKGRLSQALTSGTRAQRELDELREEFRKKTSDRFVQQARELRQQATELAEAQREIGQSLGSDRKESDDQLRSLRDSSPREKLDENLARQKERLDNLLQSMQDAVRDAEEPQPLLAEQLYDSYRRANQNRLQDKLRETQRSVQRGFLDDAQIVERSAREGIELLRDDIERAAESVLGDAQESLRRARDELDTLAEQLQREIKRAEPRRVDRKQAMEPGEAASTGRAGPQRERSGRRAGGDDRDRSMEDGESRGKEDPNRADDRSDQRQGGTSRQDQQPAGEAAGQPGDRLPQDGPDEARREGERPQADGGDARSGRAGERAGDRPGNEPGTRSGEIDRDGQRQPRNSDSARRLRGDDRETLQAGGPGSRSEQLDGPLTGDNFRAWSDRLRNVEEMVGDPRLRSDVARVRDRAREFRTDLLRHSQQPNWDLVRVTIVQPLTELRDRIDQELQKRMSSKALVPIDRDPVPLPYVEQVRRYYERIGSGE